MTENQIDTKQIGGVPFLYIKRLKLLVSTSRIEYIDFDERRLYADGMAFGFTATESDLLLNYIGEGDETD